MIKRIVEISSAKTRLSIKHGQLFIRDTQEVIAQIPCEDIGVLLVDHQGTIYSHSVFTELLASGAAVVLCGRKHRPTGMLLPLESHTLQTERFRRQIEVKEPLKKRLWKQIVRAKIRHQARIVDGHGQTYRALMVLMNKVHSGDPENIEAQASRRFWPCYIENSSFRRKVDGPPPNNLLNYGYMVMRAGIARALCSAGLLPCLGIHHRNRYNAFCLADDLLEPFRGFVEREVRSVWESEKVPEDLSQELRARMIALLHQPVPIAGFSGPLMVGLHRTTASLQRCFAGEQEKLELPDL